MEEKITDVPNTPLAFVWFATKPFMASFILACVTLVLVCSLEATEPFFYRYIIDSLVTFKIGSATLGVWLGIVGYLGVVGVRMVLWRIVVVGGQPWLLGSRAYSRTVLTEYLLKHSQNYFENRFAGSVANKISHAGDGVRNLAEAATIDFVPVVLGMIFGIATAFYANVSLGVIFTLWVLFSVPINIWLAKKRVPYTLETQMIETRLRGLTVDVISNIRAVQEFFTQSFELELVKPVIEARKRAGIRNNRFGQLVVLVNAAMYVLLLAAMLVTTTHLVINGMVSVGTVALVMSLVLHVGGMIFSLGWRLSAMAESWGEIKEGLDDILLLHEIPNRNASADIHLRGDMVFNDVTFGYGDDVVLKDFDLSIASGERVGFVGKSGAGKSTLVKLLLRHYDVTGGTITIGDKDIRSVSLESLRTAIAVIPQESSLFHRSLRENIAYGKQDATDEEVAHAAKLAEADEFIKALPQGYDTLVGERGVKLSGGQRQRVAIARAILKDAPILVLDEATSALDSESEVAIQKALHTLMEGKTVIAIAHRLSTLREMDRIIVLEEGGIAEEGTHEELVAKKGLYARLWEHQAGGFLLEDN